MTQILNKDKIKETEELLKLYDSIVGEATEKAKEKTNDLMEEINYFKTHSYEDIIRENVKEWTVDMDFEKLDGGYTLPQEWYIEMKLKQKYASDKHFNSIDIQKYFDSMSEEEKKAAHIEGIKIRNAKVIGEYRKKDLLYDAITEEQISKLLELYYISAFKDEVVSKKTQLLYGKDSIIPYGPNWVNQSPSDVIFEAASIDYMGEKGLVKSATIKGELKDRLTEFLFLGGLSSVTGLLGFDLISGLSGFADRVDHSLLTPAIIVFCMAALPILYLASSHIDRKRIIKKAKELGIYDDFKEKIKATDNFEKFKRELQDEYEIEDEYDVEEGKKVL